MIKNKNLMQIKLGTIKKSRSDIHRVPTRGELQPPADAIPDRPTGYDVEEEPPLEAIDRFYEIVEHFGYNKAISYAKVVFENTHDILPGLRSGFVVLRNFHGKEQFLNGRKGHIESIDESDRPVTVQLIDNDIHPDNRRIRITPNEFHLLDGQLREEPDDIARNIG
jgi:hypothetical protein